MDRELRKQLPVTRAVGAGNLEFTLLGLKGFSWLFVFVAALLFQMATDNFPIALIGGVGAYLFIKVFIDNKPKDWLKHWVIYHITLPKTFHHRPDRRPVRVLVEPTEQP